LRSSARRARSNTPAKSVAPQYKRLPTGETFVSPDVCYSQYRFLEPSELLMEQTTGPRLIVGVGTLSSVTESEVARELRRHFLDGDYSVLTADVLTEVSISEQVEAIADVLYSQFPQAKLWVSVSGKPIPKSDKRRVLAGFRTKRDRKVLYLDVLLPPVQCLIATLRLNLDGTLQYPRTCGVFYGCVLESAGVGCKSTTLPHRRG
jgi:hypothetical protein